jgi:hypothetical protein
LNKNGSALELESQEFPPSDREFLIEGRTVIYDQRTGFSIPLEMRPLLHYRGNVLQLPAALFGKPDEQMELSSRTHFSTRLMLTNASNKAIDVTPTLRGANALGKQIAWDDQAIALGPFESRVVDLEDAHVRSGIADGYVGVQLAHTGGLVDLMAEAVTTDLSLSLAFYEPFHDGQLLGRGHHGVAFNLAGNRKSSQVIRNITDQPIQYRYRISFQEGGNSGIYLSPLQKLGARGSALLDLDGLRDAPDAEGRRLPDAVSFGHLTVFSEQKAVAVMGVTFDRVGSLALNSIPPPPDGCCTYDCGGGGACPDECSPCCDHESNICWRNLAICEGAATAGL